MRGPISKLVGGAIGLAKEYQADRKERKAAEGEAGTAAVPVASSSSSEAIPSQGLSSGRDDEEDLLDDEEWAITLDEAQLYAASGHSDLQQQQQQQEQLQSRESESAEAMIDRLLREFAERHPPPPVYTPGRLLMPVILPQRRPESRHRGFVRAYAPVLENCGVDQASWLEFLDGFEKSISANSWFHVMNIASGVAGHVRTAAQGVSIIATVVGTAIHIGIEAGRRSYIHIKTNKYLDTMNEQFFKPHGLYCLVIKYKPSSDELVEDFDLQHNITAAVEQREESSKWSHLLKTSPLVTKHEAEIPEAAPLVFPQLDAMDEQQKQNSIKRFGHFLEDYHDRQGAARFEAQHPDSHIPQAPRKEFASRYSDPNHPASTGGIVSVVTGGKYNPVGPLERLQQRRGERKSRMGISGPVGKEARQQRRENRPLKKLLKQDAVYLMVVNMPSQEELDKVAAALNAVQE